MNKQIVTPRTPRQQAAQNAARAALALFRAGSRTQAATVWAAAMEAFQ